MSYLQFVNGNRQGTTCNLLPQIGATCSENTDVTDCKLANEVGLLCQSVLKQFLNMQQIHSFSILSDDRSKASSKTMPPHSAMHSLLLQMRISSPVLKVIQ